MKSTTLMLMAVLLSGVASTRNTILSDTASADHKYARTDLHTLNCVHRHNRYNSYIHYCSLVNFCEMMFILFIPLEIALFLITNLSPLSFNDNLNTFDSYYQLTDLEPYPEVCHDYADEICAKRWLDAMNEVGIRNGNRLSNVEYLFYSNITEKNRQLQQKFAVRNIELTKYLRLKAQKFKWKAFRSYEVRRIFKALAETVESNSESVLRKLEEIKSQVGIIYNQAKPCYKTCLAAGESGIISLFKTERDYDILAGFWTAWRSAIGPKVRGLYIDRLKLEIEAARENGFEDPTSFNLIQDFEQDDFKQTVLDLFENILPLYKELHAYVRHCLARHYPGRFDRYGPIPAHLFGNVWAQQWDNIFPIIKECMGNSKNTNFHHEVHKNLAKYSVKQMFQMAEHFFDSIGMFNMTKEFWERSVLKQPKERLVDCHGTAYDFSNGVDFRILMCTENDLDHFTTIHHEMGHIQYFMAYKDLPLLFRNSANSGFHEAIGDAVALAVKTPEHLYKMGLLSQIPRFAEFNIEYLMVTALEKVAFLPFALTMESFIWGVYNGSVPHSKLNKYWWDLRYKYQGIKPPLERSENSFDPGAKYHISFGISYIRYFISFIVQFQFYESLCNISGYQGALHRCDFYQSKEAGSQFLKMLKIGRSRPWKETIKILTGGEKIHSSSLLKYFDPLYKWLKNRNKKLNIPVGW